MTDGFPDGSGGAAMAPCLQQQLESTIGTVPEVEGIYIIAGGDGHNLLRVLTIIDAEEDRVYRLIYERELELARRLPGTQLDFAVIARRSRPVEHIVGENRPAWERVPADEHCR